MIVKSALRKLFNRLHLRARPIVVVHDLLMIAVAWMLALLVRTDFSVPASTILHYAPVLPLIVLTQGILLWRSGVYHGLWRFASTSDLWNIMKSAGFGMLANSLILFLFDRIELLPRTSLLLYPVFLIFLLGSPRFIYRVAKDKTLRLVTDGTKNILILGAGKAGEMLVRDILRDSSYSPIGFLDDNPKLQGLKIHGIPILGLISDLTHLPILESIDVIVIAIPSANNFQMRKIVSICEASGIPFRTLPRLQDLVSGQPPLETIREVAIEDLLGREPISLDWETISLDLANKIVMITGGGGSIGSELARQISRMGISSLILFERCEFNLYSIEMELRKNFHHLKVHAILGDITDKKSLEWAIDTHRPDIIFHAAAYKHVPLMEDHIREAVKNNVLGTKLVALAASQFACSKFVLVSTDKAVNPSSVMGMTKRLAEIICQDLSKTSKTRFMTVRFGNVLGSSGSVVPLFTQQIQSGGPITVTHPDVTRYFMTIAEACQLIMQASVLGTGGEIFLLDMGTPIRISYLAEQMIRLSGKTPGKDIEIKFTGLRPGEKLFEELSYHDEIIRKTGHEKIHRLESSDSNLITLKDAVIKLEGLYQSNNDEEMNRYFRELMAR